VNAVRGAEPNGCAARRCRWRPRALRGRRRSCGAAAGRGGRRV